MYDMYGWCFGYGMFGRPKPHPSIPTLRNTRFPHFSPIYNCVRHKMRNMLHLQKAFPPANFGTCLNGKDKWHSRAVNSFTRVTLGLPLPAVRLVDSQILMEYVAKPAMAGARVCWCRRFTVNEEDDKRRISSSMLPLRWSVRDIQQVKA